MYFLELKKISKSFGGVQALKDVNFDILPGEVHGLAGENGAGKSTLIKICTGVLPPDSGKIFIEGREVKLRSPQDAEEMGISVIHQELPLCPNLSAMYNVFLGNSFPGSFLRPDTKYMRCRFIEIMDMLGEEIPPEKTIGECSVAEQQLVAIARALNKGSRLIIMDEPTSALSYREVSRLFEVVKKLKQQGVAFLFVSHRIAEIIEIADRITVLRDGHYVGTFCSSGVDEDKISQAIVGHKLSDENLSRSRTSNISQRRVVLEVKNLCNDEYGLKNISFKLFEGEVLGIAGLRGSGRTETVLHLFGLAKPDSGDIVFENQPVRFHSPHEALEKGIVYLTEDRHRKGLHFNLDVANNIVLSIVDSLGVLKLSHRKKFSIAREFIEKLRVKPPNPKIPAPSLSGGNQQKVLFAKLLATKPRVLILDEPTRGVDVGAKFEIRNLVADLARSGVSIILISSEIPELLALSDRIVILKEGTVIGEVKREEVTKDSLLRLLMQNQEEMHGVSKV